MKITISSEEILGYSIELRKKLAIETNNLLLMEVLSKDRESIEVLRALSLNKNLPSYLLKISSEIYDNILQRNVGRHENTGKETLSELAKSHYNAVRCAVAENKNTDSETLHCLANDRNELVRLKVVHNPSTKKETLLLLENDRLASRDAKKKVVLQGILLVSKRRNEVYTLFLLFCLYKIKTKYFSIGTNYF